MDVLDAGNIPEVVNEPALDGTNSGETCHLSTIFIALLYLPGSAALTESSESLSDRNPLDDPLWHNQKVPNSASINPNKLNKIPIGHIKFAGQSE